MKRADRIEYMADKSNSYRQTLGEFIQDSLDRIFIGVSMPEYIYSKQIDNIWSYVNSLILDAKELERLLSELEEKVRVNNISRTPKT